MTTPSTTHEIQHFDDLLRAARAQAEHQRLLLVFVTAELPEGASAAQREGFARGEGGALMPLMCVDKLPAEIASFDTLVRESREYQLPGQDWQLIFAAALVGTSASGPSDAQTDSALNRMVESIKGGVVDGYLAFDRSGQPVQLGRA
ncbi:hypothetical protein SAMN05428957_104233 [Oryzisolibacter propanilivorax]|uniref:Uncharacterized protein n=1 Tax=Oryzisolibacter propanilivorax TaxID=1527607 RepID=A0A1G9SB43_9BURK|nr:ribonucleotide reductase subunit alpha [Oryzisolibacter propanilivorax]SDM32591.1 hypothetical protein SAMN05428957_104233 [Oryzisolibacter propanilivorax]